MIQLTASASSVSSGSCFDGPDETRAPRGRTGLASPRVLAHLVLTSHGLPDTPVRVAILDSKFTEQFKRILKWAGVEVVTTAYQAPDMNAFAERWVLSVKSECLNRLILFGERSLRRALREYCAHYHTERPHQGIGNELIEPEQPVGLAAEVTASERLGGLLRSYHPAA